MKWDANGVNVGVLESGNCEGEPSISLVRQGLDRLSEVELGNVLDTHFIKRTGVKQRDIEAICDAIRNQIISPVGCFRLVRKATLVRVCKTLEITHQGNKAELVKGIDEAVRLPRSSANGKREIDRADPPLRTEDVDRPVADRFPWLWDVCDRLLEAALKDPGASVADALGHDPHNGYGATCLSALGDLGFEQFGAIFDRWYDDLPSRESTIVRKRTFCHEIATLQELGDSIGLTRERARQLEKRLKDQFSDWAEKNGVEVQARVARRILGPVTRTARAQDTLALLLTESRHQESALFALLALAGPYRTEHGWLVRSDSRDHVARLRSKFSESADRIGHVPGRVVDELTDGLFAGAGERDAFLEETLHMARIGGRWAIRDNLRVRVLFALESIGRPATKQEIADVAGLDNSPQLLNWLSRTDFVCRADKERWGFVEWIDDPYDGIAGEIKQRILEDGGQTSVVRLVQELPEMFGVSETSVRAYLNAPVFVVREGLVRLATDDEVKSTYFGSTECTTAAVRLADGEWAARIQVEQRFFSGFSAMIPGSVAAECGFRPGDSLSVPAIGYSHEVSLNWNPTNPMRMMSIGRIGPVLNDLGLSDGDDVVIAPSQDGVRFFRSEDAPVSEEGSLTDENVGGQVENILDSLFER